MLISVRGVLTIANIVMQKEWLRDLVGRLNGLQWKIKNLWQQNDS
jgi:hypothetical protein